MASRARRRNPAQQPEQPSRDEAEQAASTATGSTTGHGDDFAPDAEAAPEVGDGSATQSPMPIPVGAYVMAQTGQSVQVLTVAGKDEPVRAGGMVLTDYGWQPESLLTPADEQDDDESGKDASE